MNKQPAEDYIKKAKDIFRILNEVRKNPKIMIRHLERLRSFFDTNTKILSEPGKIRIQMVEDVEIFDNAIQFLSEIDSLNPLQWDENLAMSAFEHVLDIGPKGLLQFEGSDGTNVEDRIRKYGNYIEHLGESIDYGPNDAMGVLVSLILDDGEPEKPDRYNLFRSDYLKIGIACGPHKTEYQISVFDFTYDFVAYDDQELMGEDYIDFSQNKIDASDINTNLNYNNGNGSHQKKQENMNEFAEYSRGNKVVEKSGLMKASNPLLQNENDREIDEIEQNSNNLKPNPTKAGNIPNQDAKNKKGEENMNVNLKISDKNKNAQIMTKQTAESTKLQKGEIENKILQNDQIINGEYTENKFHQLDDKHNPIVKLSIEDKPSQNLGYNKISNAMIYNSDINVNLQDAIYRNNEDVELTNNHIRSLNNEKRIVSKQIEIISKITYTYDDGTIREVSEKNNHVFHFD